jgi:hypothetical protein
VAVTEAGRDLDRLVAEKVMGGFSGVGDIQVYTVGDVQYIGEEEEIVVGLPRYSTDIAAAWEVLDKLGPEWWPEVGRMMYGEEWYCEICRGGPTPADVGPPFRVVAPTAPLAICLAALKAVE